MNDQANAFCREKIQILKEYVTRGEELLSNIENWESLAGILAERDMLLERLQELEAQFGRENSQISCDAVQKKEIRDLIRLNTEIDQDIMKLLREEQNKTLQDLKTNHNNQKIAGYEINLKPNYGTYLDTKK